MFEAASRSRPTRSRQQSQRTTRRPPWSFPTGPPGPPGCPGPGLPASRARPLGRRPEARELSGRPGSPASFQPGSSQRGHALSVEVAVQLLRPAQLVLRPRFDLPDALAGQVEPVADLLQRPRLIVFETEAETNDLALLAVELEQRRGEIVEIRTADHLVLDRDGVERQRVAQLARASVAARERLSSSTP